MDFWLDIVKVGTLLYAQTKLIAMTTNYMGVAIDNLPSRTLAELFLKTRS